MDRSRKANRENDEITLQYKSQREARLVEDDNDDKLAQLLAFVQLLERTPPGAAELRRRKRLFGECDRSEDESSGQFCARLRHWLDREMPRGRSPRHAPRSASD
jgi:hypothetical protein